MSALVIALTGVLMCSSVASARMDYSRAAVAAPVEEKRAEPSLVRGVSLFDATLLIVGGTLGSGLFLTSADVAASTYSPVLFFLACIAGGGIALLASLS